jgi:hypothetical protein
MLILKFIFIYKVHLLVCIIDELQNARCNAKDDKYEFVSVTYTRISYPILSSTGEQEDSTFCQNLFPTTPDTFYGRLGSAFNPSDTHIYRDAFRLK